MGSFSTIHLIAKEILDELLTVNTEIDGVGDIDITLYVGEDKKHKVMLTLDYPNWATLRDAVNSHFQDFDITKKEKI